jgi:lysophospholipase L1-like esterase
LGASITYGVASTDKNGYRLALRQNVTAEGNAVNMVGNVKSGSMLDNENEGWSGYIIDQVLAKAQDSVARWKPNVITLNVGTNDCARNIDVPNAGKRMEALLEVIWTESPNSTVILSTVLVNGNANTEKNAVVVNEQYTALAKALRSSGRKVVLVDMRGPGGVLATDLADGTHPNDYGYGKMAVIWTKGLRQASTEGLITRAADIELPDNGPE